MSAPLQFAEFWSLRFSHGGYPLTRGVSQRLGACIAFLACRARLSPSFLTLCGAALVLGTSAAYASLAPGWGSAIALLLMYQLAYGFDCADGQLARATRTSSEFGAWLDVATDYLRYIAIAMAVFVVLVRQHGMAPLPAMAAAAALLAGTILLLHTTGYLQDAARHAPAQAPASPWRTLVRIALDTPTYLLALCLLRDHALPLWAYAIAIGAAYAGTALLLALRSIAGAPGAAR